MTNVFTNYFEVYNILFNFLIILYLLWRKTKYKKLTVSIQFPDDYPNSLLFVELKSKVISQPTLQQIMKSCQNHLNYYLGSKQVLKIYLLLLQANKGFFTKIIYFLLRFYIGWVIVLKFTVVIFYNNLIYFQA